MYLTDFFVLGRRDYAADRHLRQRDVTNTNAILACIAGAIIGILTHYTHSSITDIPTIGSFLSAASLYVIAEKLRRTLRRDGKWRLKRYYLDGRLR